MARPQTTARGALFRLWGTITEIASGRISIAGISAFAGIGGEISIEKDGDTTYGEILEISGETVTALLFSSGKNLRIGDIVHVEDEATVDIGDHWLGSIVNFRGEATGQSQNGKPRRVTRRQLHVAAPPAHARRELGARLPTGLMATDTLLPICAGQRMGLFAGSGVGKSRLLAALASGLAADRVVIALIGERSREVNEFVRSALPAHLLEKTVIVAATSGEPPGAKKRAAYCAMAAAEHFRDEGHHVLFLFDSVTRFAEAHRETALVAGETPALNAFPPSTVRVVAELAERSGPGITGTGDITAVYTVLVAGSDFEEPVADMIRGILDGHIILSREIAERGRYPAIDVLKSVSRALPNAASDTENEMIRDYRRMIALYGEVSPMVRANLYGFGIDPMSDRAIRLFPALDAFAGEPNVGNNADAFAVMARLLDETVVRSPS